MKNPCSMWYIPSQQRSSRVMSVRVLDSESSDDEEVDKEEQQIIVMMSKFAAKRAKNIRRATLRAQRDEAQVWLCICFAYLFLGCEL